MQWWRDWKPHKWLDVQFALEQFSGAEGNKDGVLFIYYTFNDEKKVIPTPNLEHSYYRLAYVCKTGADVTRVLETGKSDSTGANPGESKTRVFFFVLFFVKVFLSFKNN